VREVDGMEPTVAIKFMLLVCDSIVVPLLVREVKTKVLVGDVVVGFVIAFTICSSKAVAAKELLNYTVIILPLAVQLLTVVTVG
jgi:hypothetical protein